MRPFAVVLLAGLINVASSEPSPDATSHPAPGGGSPPSGGGPAAFAARRPAPAPPSRPAGVIQQSLRPLDSTLVRSPDIVADGAVDERDRDALLAAWGTNSVECDLNGSGAVDGADLGLLLGAWTAMSR